MPTSRATSGMLNNSLSSTAASLAVRTSTSSCATADVSRNRALQPVFAPGIRHILAQTFGRFVIWPEIKA